MYEQARGAGLVVERAVKAVARRVSFVAGAPLRWAGGQIEAGRKSAKHTVRLKVDDQLQAQLAEVLREARSPGRSRSGGEVVSAIADLEKARKAGARVPPVPGLDTSPATPKADA